MQSPNSPSFGGGKHVKPNVVVPMAAGDADADAAEGGASPFASTRQGVLPNNKQLPLSDAAEDPSALAFCYDDGPVDQRPSGDASNYGKQQSRLAAQLVAKSMRRPSHLRKATSEQMDGQPGNEEVGPWGDLQKDAEAQHWWNRLKQRIQRLLLIRPGGPRLQYWSYLCVALAVLSGWVIPYHFAFQEAGGLLRPYGDWVACIEYLGTAVFMLDFFAKFNIAYLDSDSGDLVTDRLAIARNYVKSWQFAMDVLGWFPLDWIVIESAASAGAGEACLTGLAWLKLLHLARLYRLFELFTDLDYRMVLSQGTLLLTRNYTYVFFVTHWASCMMYHIAHQEGFSPDSWVGRNAHRFVGRPDYEKYLLSLYLSVSVFTGLGDGALFASTVPEAAFMVLYLFFNLFLGAYILGTVTMLVVKGDERSKQFRERMSNLNEFSKTNDLPERLQSAMQEHLEVTFNTEQVDDEHVLGIYPATIRRKVLRHLYLQSVKSCYLFKGCKQRFLDALLTAARVELFMPGVQLMVEGDNVTELNIIVSGDVTVAEAGINLSAAFSQYATEASTHGSRAWTSADGSVSSMAKSASMSRSMSIGRTTSLTGSMIGDSSMHGVFSDMPAGRPVMERSSSDALAEVPFFTDVPSNETILSQSVLRVLSLPKHAWELLMQQFPQQARLVLTNLQTRTELAMAQEGHEVGDAAGLSEEELKQALIHVREHHKGADKGKPESELVARLREVLSQPQIDHLLRLDDVRAVVRAHVRKVDQVRTFEFLGSASDGDLETLRNMLNQGMSPNSADYDGRTGLMLAASGGHEAVVRLLLDSGARSDELDAFGNSAMCEAVKNAHDNVIDLLLSYGASLGMETMAVASVMCTAVFEGDLIKLRRLLRSGAPPDACDYDRRSALHIAGAEGNLAAVKLLVEEGGADPNFQDRWGNTALDEGRRVGAAPVVAYLEGLMGNEQVAGSGHRYRQQLATDFLSACSTGDAERVRFILHNGSPGCVFSGLVLAASKGHKSAVDTLVVWLPADMLLAEGHIALAEAARMGHSAAVVSLRAGGVKLPDPRDGTLLTHLRNAVNACEMRIVAALLAAGVDATGTVNGGGSLLHAAVATGSLELVRRLVEDGGVRPDAEDSAGKTAAAVAEASKQPYLVDYLRWAGAFAASPAFSMQGLVAAARARFGTLPDLASPHAPDDADPQSGDSASPPRTPMSEVFDDDMPQLIAHMGPVADPTGALHRQGSQGAPAMIPEPLVHNSSMPKLNSVGSLPRQLLNNDPHLQHLHPQHPLSDQYAKTHRHASLTGFLHSHMPPPGEESGATPHHKSSTSGYVGGSSHYHVSSTGFVGGSAHYHLPTTTSNLGSSAHYTLSSLGSIASRGHPPQHPAPSHLKPHAHPDPAAAATGDAAIELALAAVGEAAAQRQPQQPQSSRASSTVPPEHPAGRDAVMTSSSAVPPHPQQQQHLQQLQGREAPSPEPGGGGSAGVSGGGGLLPSRQSRAPSVLRPSLDHPSAAALVAAANTSASAAAVPASLPLDGQHSVGGGVVAATDFITGNAHNNNSLSASPSRGASIPGASKARDDADALESFLSASQPPLHILPDPTAPSYSSPTAPGLGQGLLLQAALNSIDIRVDQKDSGNGNGSSGTGNVANRHHRTSLENELIALSPPGM